MSTTRAIIYTRISQDRIGAGLGVDRQREDCEALAKNLGWTVVGVRSDNDISAFSGKHRPGYEALLGDLAAGRATAVIVWHTDRLHRSPRELEDYIALCEPRGITTATVMAGSLDLNTSSGRMVARMLGAAARQEVEHKSDRIKAAQLQKARAGGWIGGTRPIGWNVRADGSATLDRKAANRIRKATAAVLAGQSLGSIVTEWNAAGFTSARGKAWTYATLRQVLTRARNAGLIEHGGAIVATSTWPAIVSEDSWRALCAMLADPTRRRSQSNRVRHLLAGIALCGKAGCGAVLRSATAGTTKNGAPSKRTVYRCTAPGTGHVARSASELDALIDRLVVARLSRQDVRDLLPIATAQQDLDELHDEAVGLRARLDEAAGSFADGKISGSQLATITQRVNDRLALVDGLLATAARGSALGEFVHSLDPVGQWRAATLERRRVAITEMMTVTVLPGLSGREFDPSLIRVEWIGEPGSV